uniref:Uncharacterized protein n=1 Tax=Aegilops tauschii TaxID=37682 RepID=M8BZ96_AEGTA
MMIVPWGRTHSSTYEGLFLEVSSMLAQERNKLEVKEIKNCKEARISFMIMENLLFGSNILRRYDLKGALFSRYPADSSNPKSVLLDQTFIKTCVPCLSTLKENPKTSWNVLFGTIDPFYV